MVQLPLIILSTLATTIASQALISGVFSITRQAVQLGFCPRINVIHTSVREIGQIYVPFVNWALFLGVIWLVLNFKSSSHLAAAYGIAVSGTMLMTTICRFLCGNQKVEVADSTVSYFIFNYFLFDVSFFFPNLLKITHGGWVPLVLGEPSIF